jgi:hypothetical protein
MHEACGVGRFASVADGRPAETTPEELSRCASTPSDPAENLVKTSPKKQNQPERRVSLILAQRLSPSGVILLGAMRLCGKLPCSTTSFHFHHHFCGFS